jgi:hypothetical protein
MRTKERSVILEAVIQSFLLMLNMTSLKSGTDMDYSLDLRSLLRMLLVVYMQGLFPIKLIEK